jgi:transposase InsO family protein
MAAKPVLHGDNGSTLKATTVLAMLNWLGIKPSYSRPRVSDDNAYAESLFRSGSACLNSFTPRDKETTGGLNRCRVVHGGGRRLRRTGRRGGQLGEHQGFSFYAAACIDGSIAQ